ncbi:MazG nucleotide pyrophosphohydrolase [Segniliparus rotundus DSM 44985]|uniref:MazG nucleotide pyrophosphohydrolase n=1 Tax=Segniliparus rotundus (strain ATCC BAA-972 / CDC 1076 / CIP 108378 / DSM 44985 / JCM 13578) TaxID=640132 RepID=D6ZCL4_SEGRD|nr:nucleotide pyrophosphohydrolase [Segniliparus rotundus]ADG97056.1 MazG nucleotide pyrophosphohydrolase [Segniliparus rotundus DSM 44985]
MSGLEQYAGALAEFVAARDWHLYDSPKNLALALGGEVGELMAVMQWLSDEEIRQKTTDDEDFRRALSFEMADVLNYLLRLARHVGVDLIEAAEEKLAVNEIRYPVARAKGNATKHNAL